MKKLFFLPIFIFYLSLNAQVNDQQILLGETLRALVGSFPINRYKLDFSTNIPKLSVWQNMPICSGGFPLGANVTNAFVVADTLGKALLVTNGRRAVDSQLDTIQGAYTLWQHNLPEEGYDNSGLSDQFYLLPINDTIFQILYYARYALVGDDHPVDRKLVLHEFRVNPDTKAVRLTIKDSVITTYRGLELSAPTRHANGKDWVFVLPTIPNVNAQGLIYLSDIIFRQEVWQTSDLGVVKTNQFIEYNWGWDTSIFRPNYVGVFSQKGFSPNGEKYYFCDVPGCMVFDFNRCSGQLSNRKVIDIPSNISYLGQHVTTHGANISPNNRFLYMTFTQGALPTSGISFSSSVPHYILQYDLEAPDIEASIDTIAITGVFDSIIYPSPPYSSTANFGRFKSITYGIDGKLWVSSGWDNLSYIEYPDSAGQACGFKSRAIVAPMQSTHWRSFNQRLGPVDGSLCDTLGINNDPRADFRWKSDDCFTVKFRNTSWHEPTSFKWDFGDGTTSTEQEPKHTYTKGIYKACLLASNQYGEHAFCREIDLVACGSVSTDQPQEVVAKAVMSPNPTTGPLQLTYQLNPNRYDGALRIYDAQGRLAFGSKLTVNRTSFLFDISHLPTGLYFWSLNDGAGQVASGKVVKLE
jgi:PKD domain/Secretion system C-terminal sorting domain